MRRYKPDVAIVDVRMPPTQTDEGARAAVEIRAEHPGGRGPRALAGDRGDARARLFSERPEGFGYLLKDRVLEIDDFLDAVRRVGKGGDGDRPEVICQLLGRKRAEGPLDELTRASARCSN